MQRWLVPAGCIAFGLACVLGPDAAQFAFVVAALALLSAAVVSANSWPVWSSDAQTRVHVALGAGRLQRSASEHERELVRLVLLSQPRR